MNQKHLKEKMKGLTILIGTKNRANGRDGYPLNWILESIQNQTYIPKVLVMDDYSTTDQSIKTKELCEKNGFDYHRSKKAMGCSGIRREALNKITTPWHLILDDDLLFYNSKTIENILQVLDDTKEKDLDLGALILPAYDRVPFPTRIVPKNKIGKIDVKNALTYWNLSSFPKEFFKEKIKPILIEIAGSYGVYNTELLKKLGGFRDGGQTDYAMESELAWRIRKEGKNIYYYPGLNTGSFHLRFGIKSDISLEEFVGKIDDENKRFVENYFQSDIREIMTNIKIGDKSLEKMVEISNENFNGTGCRVNEKQWVQERIENELGQIIAHYPTRNLPFAVKNYVFRLFNHAKDFRISRRRDSLVNPCIKDDSFDRKIQNKAIIKGLLGGIKKGIKWKKN